MPPAPQNTTLYLGNVLTVKDTSATIVDKSALHVANGAAINLAYGSNFVVAQGSTFTLNSGLNLTSGTESVVSGKLALNGHTTVPTPVLEDLLAVANVDYVNQAIAALVDSADMNGNTLRKLKVLNDLLSQAEIKDVSDILIAIARVDASATLHIFEEKTRATKAEDDLSSNLFTEVNTARRAEDTLRLDLSNAIAKASTAGTTERDRAIQAEKDISQNLIDEKARAIQAEKDISQNLIDEAARALKRENDISFSLITEVGRASDAESVLRQNSAWANLMPCTPAIFSDELAPMVIPAAYSTKMDGWYVKNPYGAGDLKPDGTTSKGTKANWYLSGNGLTYGDLEYIAFGYLPISTRSQPYLVVYTYNATDPNLGSDSFPYTSKTVYGVYASSPSKFTPTYVYGSVNGSTTLAAPSIPGFRGISMSVSSANSQGTPKSTDTIMTIVFNVGNTNDAAGDAEMILKEVNIVTANGTISNKFSNDSVVNFYTAQQVSALYAYLFDSSGNVPPPVTNHSGFSANTDVLKAAMANYGSSTGQVMATYQAF